MTVFEWLVLMKYSQTKIDSSAEKVVCYYRCENEAMPMVCLTRNLTDGNFACSAHMGLLPSGKYTHCRQNSARGPGRVLCSFERTRTRTISL